jgi:hypothetical protein
LMARAMAPMARAMARVMAPMARAMARVGAINGALCRQGNGAVMVRAWRW